ncbi:MAG: NeuD/PglB/VioB family sugar acetyltransferase [Cytophagaceae bacterium]|nr:NeuD/PglB/VioB family sugar acetyltransferase [Cytophagaceae bacterium]MDW8455702.1 NeuD/PglB/VioB family sugar acetyltransferase [Cytophagaceae bacterium]
MNFNPVIIFGATYLGRQALENFNSNQVTVYCFLDDNSELHNTCIDEVSVLGSMDDENFLNLLGGKCDAFIATDDYKLKNTLLRMLKEEYKVMPANCIHKDAVLASNAYIGHGNMINAKAVINAGAKISNHCIVASLALIDTEAIVEDFVHVGPGAIIGPEAKIEEGAFIGAGAIVVGGVKIGKKARVGAGSVVISNIEPGSTVFGNPAEKI